MIKYCLLYFSCFLGAILSAQVILPSTPSSLRDVKEIQTRLQAAIPATIGATVCLEMGGSSGSGVIVSPDGLIYTAAHVATGVRREMTVILSDGTKLKAKSLGVDTVCDAAMLQIINLEKKLPYVTINHKDQTLGDWCFSLGHSGGWDAARGVGVRLGRIVGMPENTLQTDCKLIGGDSGGPLFNMKGELIGIHSRVGTQLESNMHVPMAIFDKYQKELKASKWIGKGSFARWQPALLGITLLPINEASVFLVSPDSSASRAGLLTGDIITQWEDTPIKTKSDLMRVIHQASAQEHVSISILRNGESKTINIVLDAHPAPDNVLDTSIPYWYFNE